jgi:hypothetical protein
MCVISLSHLFSLTLYVFLFSVFYFDARCLRHRVTDSLGIIQLLVNAD